MIHSSPATARTLELGSSKAFNLPNPIDKSPPSKAHNTQPVKIFPHTYGTQRFSVMSQEPTLRPCPKSDEQSTSTHPISLKLILILSSPPSSGKVKNVWSYTSTPTTHFHTMVHSYAQDTILWSDT
jgi:hypothetical protein